MELRFKSVSVAQYRGKGEDDSLNYSIIGLTEDGRLFMSHKYDRGFFPFEMAEIPPPEFSFKRKKKKDLL